MAYFRKPMKEPSRWVVALGVIGSLISILVFVTGIASVPEFVHRVAVSSPRQDANDAKMIPGQSVPQGVQLTIRSNVSDGHAFVDGAHVGSTPVTVSLTAGTVPSGA